MKWMCRSPALFQQKCCVVCCPSWSVLGRLSDTTTPEPCVKLTGLSPVLAVEAILNHLLAGDNGVPLCLGSNPDPEHLQVLWVWINLLPPLCFWARISWYHAVLGSICLLRRRQTTRHIRTPTHSHVELRSRRGTDTEKHPGRSQVQFLCRKVFFFF